MEDLTKGIADTRSGVTDVKSFIDGMRSARDQKVANYIWSKITPTNQCFLQMADLNALKSQLKEQNQRLLQVTQEKARLEAKNKINQMKEEDGVGESSFISSMTELKKSQQFELTSLPSNLECPELFF